MERREISQEERDALIDDASWLQDEADALQYVIDTVPCRESPPEGRSIAEMLLLLDHAQQEYYRPAYQQGKNHSTPIEFASLSSVEEDFTFDEERAKDIPKVLGKISKHRGALVSLMKEISLIDWEQPVETGEGEMMLFDLARGMVRFERGILKEIAEQVRVFHQDKQAHRELKQRRAERDRNN